MKFPLYTFWPGELSDETCDSITEHGMGIKPQQAGVGNAGDIEMKIRSALTRTLNRDDPQFRQLFELVDSRFGQANRSNFGVDLDSYDFMNMTTYEEDRQGQYVWHHDLFWDWAPYHRKLSCVIQLSCPNTYEGGDLQLDSTACGGHPDPAEMRARGSIIIFPAFVPHRVTTVTKGVRHSLVAWMLGPQWR